jgi:hypothetical protein
MNVMEEEPLASALHAISAVITESDDDPQELTAVPKNVIATGQQPHAGKHTKDVFTPALEMLDVVTNMPVKSAKTHYQEMSLELIEGGRLMSVPHALSAIVTENEDEAEELTVVPSSRSWVSTRSTSSRRHWRRSAS